MKRAVLALVAIIVGYQELSGDLAYWLPAWGAVYGGEIIGQSVILTVLAAIVFGSAVFLAYRALSWILD
jgi:hypothetical protein